MGTANIAYLSLLPPVERNRKDTIRYLFLEQNLT